MQCKVENAKEEPCIQYKGSGLKSLSSDMRIFDQLERCKIGSFISTADALVVITV